MSTSRQPTDKPDDGRRKRGDRNRQKIVTAVYDLIAQGVLSPTADQVAARAEVGPRSVFRHFKDMEQLHLEVGLEVDKLVQAVIQTHLVCATWQERLAESITLRTKLYETIMPFHQSAQLSRCTSEVLDAQQRQYAKAELKLVAKLLPPSIAANKATVTAMALLLSADAWLKLRRDLGLSHTAARRTMIAGARALAGIAAAS